MSNIAILPETLINKIAAGEVIERPGSVVRELIDNSIDAGAIQIDIEVLYGGKKLIKVSDNGVGMDRDDALMCFERHATSKIKSEEELFTISTLGFRGEALSAIASVSKVTLTTSTNRSDIGIMIDIGTSKKKKVSEVPPVNGTSIEVRDIFYNIPARRKFLKTVSTELSHIIETVIQKAFAYPEISFRLIHNNSEVINAPFASHLKERFIQLYGKEMASEFIKIGTSFFSSREGAKGIKVYGFTSAPDFPRTRRSHQFIFVNKRPVKNPTISHAVYSAYDNIIPKDKHPAYFLFIEIDPRKVDVNVHPAKREVKFEIPDEIHRIVESTIYTTLNSGRVKDMESVSDAEEVILRKTPGFNYKSQDTPIVSESASSIYNNSQTDFFTSGIASDISPFFHIGESFIAKVSRTGLEIIDQHAAHERILYEKFLKKTSIETESLFLPLRVELPAREYNIIIRHKDFLHTIGLDIEEFGSNNLIVRALPKELNKADTKGLLMDIADGIFQEEMSGIKGNLTEETLLKNIAARLACHKSVRGSEYLNDEELSKMMADLDKTEEPDKCPHGRPTRIYFSLDDLQKMFRRKK